MKRNPNPNHGNPGLSLIQAGESREAMLVKMRGKLAGMPGPAPIAGAKRASRNKPSFNWRWGFYAAALLGLCNYAYLSQEESATAPARESKAEVLLHPRAGMGPDEQALYWAYALYDFDKLVSQFGVAGNTIVDTGLASANLNALLPQVDDRTRFIIRRYSGEAAGSRP